VKNAEVLGEGFWEALFVFNPFIAGENPRVTNLSVAEEVDNVLFKTNCNFLMTPNREVPQRNYENDANIKDKNIKPNAQYGVHE
jgi:hypothetical protein